MLNPRGHKWLSAVSYFGETDLAQYHTAWRFLETIWLSRLNVPLNRIWKSHMKSHDSPQYDTPGRMTRRSMITQVYMDSALYLWYPGEIDSSRYHIPVWFRKIGINRRNHTKIENILTQESANDVKTEGRKSRWTVPLTTAYTVQYTTVMYMTSVTVYTWQSTVLLL